MNVDLGSEFGASRGRCIGPFPSLTRDPTLQSPYQHRLYAHLKITFLFHHKRVLNTAGNPQTKHTRPIPRDCPDTQLIVTHITVVVDKMHTTLQFICRPVVSAEFCVPRQTSLRTDNPESCTIMNKIHPTFQTYPSLSTQVKHSVAKCPSRSLIIASTLRLI